MTPPIRKFVFLVLPLVVACCSTVVPDMVQSHTASWDGNIRNSGIIAEAPGGFIVTPAFRDRYNDLIATYGASTLQDGSPIFSPPLQKDAGLIRQADGTWLMDRQHMADMTVLNNLRRMGWKP